MKSELAMTQQFIRCLLGICVLNKVQKTVLRKERIVSTKKF